MKYNEHDYILQTLELPNIVMATAKTSVQPLLTDPTTDPLLLPLITRLAKTRPKWTLVGTDCDRHRGVYKFLVFENGEELGVIKREYSYRRGVNDYLIGIDNPRMEASRQRGHLTTTKDPKKAYKIVTTHFSAKTVSELLASAHNDTRNNILRATSALFGSYHSNKSRLDVHFINYAVEHWDGFSRFALAQGASEVAVAQYLEQRNAHAEGQLTSTAVQAGEQYVVVLRGSEYIIKKAGEDMTSIQIYSSSELPPYLKRCIGLLKVAPVDTYIPTVGIKTDDNTMLVLPERGDAQ